MTNFILPYPASITSQIFYLNSACNCNVETSRGRLWPADIPHTPWHSPCWRTSSWGRRCTSRSPGDGAWQAAAYPGAGTWGGGLAAGSCCCCTAPGPETHSKSVRLLWHGMAHVEQTVLLNWVTRLGCLLSLLLLHKDSPRPWNTASVRLLWHGTSCGVNCISLDSKEGLPALVAAAAAQTAPGPKKHSQSVRLLWHSISSDANHILSWMTRKGCLLSLLLLHRQPQALKNTASAKLPWHSTLCLTGWHGQAADYSGLGPEKQPNCLSCCGTA